MTTLDDFNRRLDAEFAKLSAGIEHRRSVIDREYQERQQRFADEFVPAVAKVREIFAPRSEALVARFKDIGPITSSAPRRGASSKSSMQ